MYVQWLNLTSKICVRRQLKISYIRWCHAVIVNSTVKKHRIYVQCLTQIMFKGTVSSPERYDLTSSQQYNHNVL